MHGTAGRPPRWSATSQAFHWASAALLVALGGIGLWMVDLPNGPDKIRVYALHKSLGISLLALVVLRLAWRLLHPAPAAMDGTSSTLRRAAGAVHAALYVLMFAMPVSGWLLNSAAGYPLQWFRLFNLPPLAARDPALADRADAFHEWAFWLLVLLVVGHVAAALYHHLFLGDGTLRRMLPARRPPREPLP